MSELVHKQEQLSHLLISTAHVNCDLSSSSPEITDDYERQEPSPLLKLKTNRTKAIIAINIFAFTLFLHQVTAKVAVHEKHINALDLELIRTVTITICAYLNTKALGYDFHVPKDMRPFVACRALFGTIGLTSLTFGVLLIPLAVANIIYNTAVVWSAIMAYLLLGERLSKLQVYGLVVSFVGIALITYSSLQSDPDVEGSSSSKTAIVIGCLCCLLTAVLLGIVTVQTRMMQNILFSVIFFYYGLVSSTLIGTALFGECLIRGQELRLLSYTKEQYLYALLPSAINYIAYGSQTIAMQNDSPAFVTLMAYIGLFYSFLGDTIIFHEQIKGLTVVGIVLILGMNVWMVVAQLKEDRKVKNSLATKHANSQNLNFSF